MGLQALDVGGDLRIRGLGAGESHVGELALDRDLRRLAQLRECARRDVVDAVVDMTFRERRTNGEKAGRDEGNQAHEVDRARGVADHERAVVGDLERRGRRRDAASNVGALDRDRERLCRGVDVGMRLGVDDLRGADVLDEILVFEREIEGRRDLRFRHLRSEPDLRARIVSCLLERSREVERERRGLGAEARAVRVGVEDDAIERHALSGVPWSVRTRSRERPETSIVGRAFREASALSTFCESGLAGSGLSLFVSSSIDVAPFSSIAR